MRGRKFSIACTTVMYVHNFRVVCQFCLQMSSEKADGEVTGEIQANFSYPSR